MLTKIPIANVSANPLINEVENMNKIAQTIREFTLLSLIDGQALVNPSFIANPKSLPCLISSFILAKIKMLASTAIPIDKIKPPTPAKVSVMGINLKIERIITT